MRNNPKALFVLGTRPEAIKLAPVILEFRKRGITCELCSTGQHKEMLQQVFDLFDLSPDYDLKVMREGQGLTGITANILLGFDKVILESRPDIVLVQGDTSSAFTGALGGFYHKIPVVHIEAGLRTETIYDPFPEEMNRRLISKLAALHFAPTERAKKSLLQEGVASGDIEVVGNTVIDALLLTRKKTTANQELERALKANKRSILLTTHRRENLGEGMENIFAAISELLSAFPDTGIVFPVHLNPVIQDLAKKHLGDNSRAYLMPPLSYTDLVHALDSSFMVMTDSGGIQEEAPSLGKPVLVLRNTTERPEGVEAGTAKLIGVSKDVIVREAKELLANPAAYAEMANAVNPYGDGSASRRIADRILASL